MSLTQYKHLSAWIAKFSKSPHRISTEIAPTPETKFAIEALNDLAEILTKGDERALKELLKLRQRDDWLQKNSSKDEGVDAFFDIPQTD
ncbi:MAG: hypothetical protein NXH70_13350 [Hyphomonas sp.]|nr:hypothetical protein [Hyphomonas sp.]